jgi:hypothetical protein
VRTTRVWRRVLGVEHTVIEWVDLEPDRCGGEVLVAQVRPKAGGGVAMLTVRAALSGL